MSDVASLADATPVTRDRYVDFLRVASLAGVMIGHFAMAVVLVDDAGGQRTVAFTNVLALSEPARWGTWILQVMPIFFVVGGFAHATAWRSLRRKGGGYADFASARIGRLVRPALVFVAVGLAAGAIVERAFPDRPDIAAVLQLAGQLLWFIGIYLIAAALAPAMLRAHERFGVGALAVLVALAVSVDVLRLGFDVPGVMWLNFAFVWLAIHQLGFFYADGVADRVGARRLGGTMVVAGGASAALLIALGPYGVSLVSYEGEPLSNLAPPTTVLLAFAVLQAGVLLLVRAPVTRWLQNRAVWKGVIVGGGVAMTAYLWHFTALILTYVLLFATGVSAFPEPFSGAWWAWRLPLFLLFVVLVVALVAVFRRLDRPPARAEVVGPSAWRTAVAIVGVVCGIVGMVGFAVVGFRGVTTGYVAHVLGLPMTSVAAAILVAASVVLTAVAVRRSRPAGSP